jgi:hypothetical protein
MASFGSTSLASRTCAGTARIRYSTKRDHVFYRARRREYPIICRQLVASEDFLGAIYSIGDQAIGLRAQQLMSPGGPTSWIACDTNHHLELVSAQTWDLLLESL